ncbi:hypothetical protein IWW42_005901, partial [Coemansia sp. RSA 1085]
MAIVVDAPSASGNLSAVQRRAKRRVVHVQLPPPVRAISSIGRDSIGRDSSGSSDVITTGKVSQVVSRQSPAETQAPAPSALFFADRAVAMHPEAALEHSANRHCIWLPSDIIDAVADALIAAMSSSPPCAQTTSMQRLGVAPDLAADAQAALRVLTHVCRHWRYTLLSRAWRTVQLTGGSQDHHQHTVHAFAASSVRRLVVPWGAMAVPVLWPPAMADYSSDMEAESASVDADADADSSTSSVGLSVVSHGQLHSLSKHPDHASSDQASSDHASPNQSLCRMRSVFGDQPWPAAEHLDMSFMPLICYQGFAAHVQRTMPHLRTLRISGLVPATALSDILELMACLPLEAVEIAGSVWANSDSGRRGSASSWRSSVSTVAAPDPAAAAAAAAAAAMDADEHDPARHALAQLIRPVPSLAVLVLTSDALRTPAVFAFVMAQQLTLRALHLLECDYKIMDMLRIGRLDERHMHAVDWSVLSPMALHRQPDHQVSSAYWPALQRLHIEQYYMAPRGDAGLRVHADTMPALQQLIVSHMEPSNSYQPGSLQNDAAHVPRLQGQFAQLVRIKAPMFHMQSLPACAPALRSLCITGSGGVLPQAMVPGRQEVDTLLAS